MYSSAAIHRSQRILSHRRALLYVILIVLELSPRVCLAQSKPNFTEEKFDVISVRKSRSADGKLFSNVPLGAGDIYAPVGGIFKATNMPLILFIQFAYKITPSQQQVFRKQLPAWVSNDRFDIEARSEDMSATKDQLRMMMRNLLADRFKLAIHSETKKLPVFAIILVKPGKTGPNLQPYSKTERPCGDHIDQPTQVTQPDKADAASRFPSVCGGFVYVPPSSTGLVSGGARNVPMKLIADSLSGMSGMGRPVVDQTGLTENFNFVFEFMPDRAADGTSADNSEPKGPTFLEAIKEQLGLRLEPQTGNISTWVLDHIEQPTEN